MLLALALAALLAGSDGPPHTAAELAATVGELSKSCNAGQADACSRLGRLHDETYLDLKTGFRHQSDPRAARAAFHKALALLEPRCDARDAQACNQIADIYFSESMEDPPRRLQYLERGCAAGDGWSCFDRGQSEGRSKANTVRWYAAACRLGQKQGCTDLPMMVVSALVLDSPNRPPMESAELTDALAHLDPGTRPIDRSALQLARAAAQLWAGDKRGALAAFAKAEADAPADEPQVLLFAEYGQLFAADGLDAPRVQQAWKALMAHSPQRDGKYKLQELESDYAWADPTEAMQRAERIAARNPVR